MKDARGRPIHTTLGERCPECKRRDALVVLDTGDPANTLLACEFCDYVESDSTATIRPDRTGTTA